MSSRISIPATDGFPLAATLFEPPSAAKAVVIISAATAVSRRYYAAYARFVMSQGFVAVTYDYRGIADSKNTAPLDTRAVRMRHWGARDLAGVIDEMHRRYPHLLIAAVGHSVGGQLLGLAANNHRVAVQLGLAAQSGYWRHWPLRRRLGMFWLWHVTLPVIAKLLGKIPARLMGGEIPAGVALEWARWGRNPAYFCDDADQTLHEHFERYLGRMCFIAISDDDDFAPHAAVVALTQIYCNAHIEMQIIRPEDFGLTAIGHFGFFRPTMPEDAWLQTTEWLHSALTMVATRT